MVVVSSSLPLWFSGSSGVVAGVSGVVVTVVLGSSVETVVAGVSGVVVTVVVGS